MATSDRDAATMAGQATDDSDVYDSETWGPDVLQESPAAESAGDGWQLLPPMLTTLDQNGVAVDRPSGLRSRSDSMEYSS